MARVVGRVARCELVESERPAYNEFQLVEFAVLDDGRRLAVRNDRGFPQSIREGLSRADLEIDIVNTLLPDEPESPGQVVPVDVAWQWAVDALAAQGIGETAAHFASLPTQIEYSPGILAMLDNDA